MNLIRSSISVLMLILLGLSIAGWVWAGGQPPAKKQGARVVLALCGVAAIGGMGAIWSAKQPQMK